MKLADRVAQSRKLLTVQDPATGRETTLTGAASCAEDITKCSLRYVLSDDLTRLCAELAYSKGARNLACADLLHVPAQALWVEWCHAPFESALQQYGFPSSTPGTPVAGRRGALVRSSPSGRRGTVRTFWTVGAGAEVLASSMEAYFDFDTSDGEEPGSPDSQTGASIRVYDGDQRSEDVLARCFRFRYEGSWANYYRSAALSPLQHQALTRYVLGTIAIDIPILLAFLLLLASRASLPRHPYTFERLNRSRRKCGRWRCWITSKCAHPCYPSICPAAVRTRTGSGAARVCIMCAATSCDGAASSSGVYRTCAVAFVQESFAPAP